MYDGPMKRSGVADLPLHGGRVPPWLAMRMVTLGTAIAESVLHHYGRSALLSRLSDPFWFQAFGSVMGMDWHSSGITTSVMGALKKGLNPRSHELGVYVCGGRGRQSRKTPDELRAPRAAHGPRRRRTGSHQPPHRTHRQQRRRRRLPDLPALVRRDLRRRVGGRAAGDERSAAAWPAATTGTRPTVRDFTADPHTAIVGEHAGTIVNLVDRRARPAQDALLAIARDDPARTLADVRRLEMPAHHDVRRGRREREAPRRRARACTRARPARLRFVPAARTARPPHAAIACAHRRSRARRARRASTIPRGSHSRTAARTVIPSPCRCGSTTSRSRCCGGRSSPRNWAAPTSWTAWRASTPSFARSSGGVAPRLT